MEENKFLVFFKKNWKRGATLLLLVATIAVWSERLVNKGKKSSAQDFLLVKQIFERYETGETLPLESYEIARNIVKKHPELHAIYDGMLFSTCLCQNLPLEAANYGSLALGRIRQELPAAYIAYSEITLMLSRKELSEGYVQSMALEEQLKNSSQFEMLRAFNLLRLIFLAPQISSAQDRQSFIDRLTSLASYKSLEPLFEEGSVTLKSLLQSK